MSEILKAFQVPEMDPKVLESIESMLSIFKFDAEDLLYKWEAFATANKFGSIPSVDQLDLLRQEIMKQMEKPSHVLNAQTIKKLVPKSQSKPIVEATPQKKATLDFSLLSSPPVGASAFSPSVKPPKKMLERKDRGKVVSVLNDHITVPEKTVRQPATVQLIPGQQTVGYRYMYERLQEKGDLLNDRINYFANLVGPTLFPDQEENPDFIFLFGHPSMPSQQDQYYIGRITSDTMVDETKLNMYSIMLEGSTAFGGSRVKLEFSADLTSDPIFDLFPGQIVCLHGSNPSGSLIKVDKFVKLPELDKPTTSGAQFKQYYKQGQGTTNIVFANGPYTTIDRLDYIALEEFVKAMELDPPDVIVLTGPFVDVEHELIQSGVVYDMDVYDIFANYVTPHLIKLLQLAKDIQVVLIPSQHDSCLEWLAFPQPPLCSALTEEQRTEKLKAMGLVDPNGQVPFLLFPNPVQFRINEIVIAVSRADVMWDMFRLQISKVDRFSNCFRHILDQRHFYPIFPPKKGACLDSTRALISTPEGPCALQVKPDILCLASDMTYRCQVQDGVICINAQKATQGKGLGFYSKVLVHSLETEKMNDEDFMEHFCDQRTRVEIIRL